MAKREPTTEDEWIVYSIRLLWSGDSGTDFDYPFGSGDMSLTMEEADAQLLAAFKAEQAAGGYNDLDTIWTLIRG